MKIFLSWSGRQSKEVAQILREWLPAVIQAARPYFSPDDIGKGARWSSEIANELQDSKVGILCVTRQNLAAPWLLFEAGALAKTLNRTCVIPLVIDIEAVDLSGPLSQFQAARFDRQDMKRVIKVINEQLGSSALDETVLLTVFDKWWPDLESKVKVVASDSVNQQLGPSRTDRAVLEEILSLVRDQSFRAGEVTVPVARRALLLTLPLNALELTERTMSGLQRAGLSTIGDVVAKSEADLLKIPNFRHQSLNEVKEVLASRGLFLG